MNYGKHMEYRANMRKLLVKGLMLLVVFILLPNEVIAQQTNKWGMNDDGLLGGKIHPNAMEMASDMGVGWIRLWLYWNLIEPANGQYNWTNTDHAVRDAIANANAANGNDELKIYATILWAPSWATGGSGHYTPWACMTCTNPPMNTNCHYDPHNLETDEQQPCVNGEPPDIEEFKEFVTRAVNRYPEIEYWGFWNEPGKIYGEPGGVFWHSSESIVDQILIPGYQAAKAARGDGVKIAGPELSAWLFCGGDNTLFDILNRDRDDGPFLDVITFHPYGAGDDMDNLLFHLDHTHGFLQLYSGSRPIWVTESGIGSTSPADWEIQAEKNVTLLEIIDARPWIERFFYYRLEDSRNGIIRDGVPLPAYWAMKNYILNTSISDRFRGNFDNVNCHRITGWAWDPENTNRRMKVDIFDGDTFIKTVTADHYRQDLFDAGIGDGYHAFDTSTPYALKDLQPHTVHIRYSGTDTRLTNSPRTSPQCTRPIFSPAPAYER